MVVHFGDAGLAQATVFAARGLVVVAGAAEGARVVECSVIGVMTHGGVVISRRDERGEGGGVAEVEEEEGEGGEKGD